MYTVRRGLSLLEVMIASTILVGVASLAMSSLASGTNLQSTIHARKEADGSVATLVNDLAKELRGADVNKIYLDSTAWTVTESGSDYYSFKVATGFRTSGVSTMDQVIRYERGVVLRFQKSATDSTMGELWRQELTFNSSGATTATGPWNRVADHLVWTYTTSKEPTLVRKGFSISQLDASQTSVVGNRLQIDAAARPAGVTASVTSTGIPAPTPLLTSSTAVYLRATMYDGFGVEAPDITSATTGTANLNTDYRYDITATHYPTSFTALGLPRGLSINTSTGSITGAPQVTGTYVIGLGAANSAGSDSQSLTLVVAGPVPAITSASQASATVGTSFSYVITASNSPTSYGATNLPAGLSFSTTTHTISGTPTTVGTTDVALSATNANGTGTGVVTVAVAAAPLANPPTITSPTTASGTVGASFSYQIQATNSPTTFYATSLPSGLSINTANGLITGTPTVAGSSTVRLYATNSVGTGQASLALTISSVPVPVVTSATTIAATAGTSVSYTITATNSPTGYSTTGLPTWLSGPSTSGVISGTPGDGDTGTRTFTVNASNSYGTGSASVTITVAAKPAPVITSATTASTNAGVPYSYQIVATNSPTSYFVSGLPTGLTLSSTTGLISGTPTTAGTSTIGLQATNASGSGTAILTLTVVGSTSAPTVTLGANTANGNNFQVLGTVAASTGNTLATTSFQWSATSTGYTLRRGWVSSEVGNGNNALAANEFLISGSKPSGSLTLTASIGDTTGRVGTVSRTY